MSSSLEQDYDEFKFSRENLLEEANVEEKLQNYNSNSPLSLEESQRCEICEQKFQNKKDLQTHVLIHLGKPRVVLKRIANIKTARNKEPSDQYWLEKQQKGNLKITLKRQSPVGDSLKLKLKKSPVSEDFTVVSNFDLDRDSFKKYNALAEPQDNDNKSDSEEEKTAEQSFENVMLNQDQENNSEDDNFETEPDQNPLENSEKPLMDNNEGDSGVGSDSVNPLEREDENVDDVQEDNISNLDQAELGENENEDPEESDALIATCRETIENLKKLGEQSSSRSSDLLNPNEAPEGEEEEEEEEEQEQEQEQEEPSEEEEQALDTIEELRGNSEISIVPKSALMPDRPTSSSPKGVETEIVPLGSSSSNFRWNKVSEDSSNSRDKEDNHETVEKDTPDNAEAAGSLLQNFLLEHQRNQNESNLSSSSQSFETEYVSLEKLAETVNTCRVCNEKFKDIAQLDSHRSKAGHYQCSIPDCSSLVFTTPMEVSVHKAQAHGASVSPSLSNMSPHHLSQNSPHAHSPHVNQTSPHLNTQSPHSPSVQTAHPPRNSPLTSPHTSSPTFSGQSSQVYPPVNLEQLPAPVQQLAQQVQRMPLPQIPAGMPPGANSMIPPGANFYPQPPGRPPMYRVQAPVHYPPHIAHLFAQQYGGNPYQMSMQPQMQPQIPQQVPRGRYPTVVPGQRNPRMTQPPPATQVPSVPRARLKRPMPPQMSQPQSQGSPAKRRMDVLLPDRNEDADCHVIAQQKRNDGLPVIQNVQGGASVQQANRNDSTIHLTDSITLSVRQPAQVNAMVQGTKKPDASAVANVLAARGITVTPAANKKTLDQSNQLQQQQQQQQQQAQQQQQKQLNVSTLNLNSAISIIPAASAQRKQQDQQAQFAVPQNKQSKQVTNEVERPPRPPTVDLTQDTPSLPPVVRRGRPPRMIQSLTCQVCDKRFQSQDVLQQHMFSHRTNKLNHKCNLCPAQYPTSVALATHKKTYHKEVDATLQQNGNIELALPVVDLKSPNTLNRLSSLGIQSYIPLSQLSAQTGGYFALPIVTIDGARNPNTCNLGALGATSILSLGPLKHLSNR